MLRMVFAALSGGLFGAGLLVSGMVDTTKVQGWLDVFGDWDPTLAFVLGGAIVPMAIAWRIAARRRTALLGVTIPRPNTDPLDRNITVGSVLFGMGWALAGLCPGPAMASLSFGGWGGILFFLAMGAGMYVATPISQKLNQPYAVSPQIGPSDLTAIKAAGYVAIINNRPDAEIPSDLHNDIMQRAAKDAGLAFFTNPVIGGMMTMENVTEQAAAIAASSGPVLAYCASGNRSSVVWALSNAGKLPTDDLIGIPARFGYQLEGLRSQLDAMAKQG